MAVKRKSPKFDEIVDTGVTPKKRYVAHPSESVSAFRSDLFNDKTVESFQKSFSRSSPYPHAVVESLIDTDLLRNVRSEITTHVHFTLKETDIYRIHQSGDLANLSNLDQDALRRLPSLTRLRDALYSPEFREWITRVTGAGKLSGKKTDMAVNVYTPGSYLLCHDDVIGSRRVSYILYLTNPDHPWRSEWGGGLRLYSTETRANASNEDIKLPLAEHSLNISPSFGQLSFFTVLPGESYHDVEEVYHGKSAGEDKERVRMAISGWFHLPQDGEDGYEEGLEQAQAQRSSLVQLQGATHEFDEPRIKFRHFDEPRIVMKSDATAPEIDPGDNTDENDDILTEQDLTFLLQYIRAPYLTPDMIEKISISFDDTAMLQLDQFMCNNFAQELRQYLERVENTANDTVKDHDDRPRWRIARPPHKHRYSYLQEEDAYREGASPITKLLLDLMHSHAFKKWLALATRLRAKSLIRQNIIARRFRHGKDYALANAYPNEQPQLEFTLSLTPSAGWEHEQRDTNEETNGYGWSANHDQVFTSSNIEFGGEEIYMAGDEDDETSVHSRSLPHIGRKTDPAVYRAADDGDEDNILFANTPTWNKFSVVLRDKGTLRFVKYISEAAKGDRWDIKGEVELAEDAFDDNDDYDGDDGDGDGDDDDDDAAAAVTVSESDSLVVEEDQPFEPIGDVSENDIDEEDE